MTPGYEIKYDFQTIFYDYPASPGCHFFGKMGSLFILHVLR